MKYEIHTEAQKQSLIQIIQKSQPGITVVISEFNKRRSDAQNRLLWKWNNLIQEWMAEHFGQQASAEEWHDVLVSKLMPSQLRRIKTPDGSEYKVGRTKTSRLGVKKMAEYMEKLEAYCVENMNLILPHPDDYRFAVYGERR